MKHAHAVRVGPIGFRIGSDWRGPIDALRELYRDYPAPELGIGDFTVRLFAARPWRRLVRPAITIGGDYRLADAAPLPLRQGLLAAEMAMNVQMALGQRHYLLLHAAVVERGGRALIMTGISGAGKSTLATLLAGTGWRFMADEFALIDPATGLIHAFPRLVSLKNVSIDLVAALDRDARFGPLLTATPKGDIRHLVPAAAAIKAMDVPAVPALLLFVRFGADPAVRAVPPSETFVRLTQSSTNYVALGEPGFTALTRLVGAVPAFAVDYRSFDDAVTAINRLWPAT